MVFVAGIGLVTKMMTTAGICCDVVLTAFADIHNNDGVSIVMVAVSNDVCVDDACYSIHVVVMCWLCSWCDVVCHCIDGLSPRASAARTLACSSNTSSRAGKNE